MHRLVLHLSGPLRAECDGEDLSGLSRRALALLAYLSCEPGMRAERGTLTDLLWSHRSESQAKASLRQELSVLRKSIGDLVGADRRIVWLDAGSVEKRIGPDEFLKGFDLASEGFEEWLRDMRQRDLASDPAPAQRMNDDRPSLAVLRFEEIGTTSEDMFPDGIVEEITGALSRCRDFDVIARQSVFNLQGPQHSLTDIATRLGADYLLEGSVQRVQDRVRISVQLVNGSDGRTRWTARFDDRLDDLFDLQDRIATQIAGQLSPNLRAAEILRARSKPPSVRSAYDLVLMALPHFWVHDPDDNRQALGLLDKAIALDPEAGHALAMKSWCHAQECCYLWSLTPERARAQSHDAFDKALPLAHDHAATMTALSATAALALRDFPTSEDLARRAVELDPNNAWAWMRLGWIAVYRGRHKESLDYFDRAQALSPLDPFLFNMDFGRSAAKRALGQLDEALCLIEKGMRAAPKAHWAYRMLFGTLWLMGERDRAVEAGQKWLAAHPGLSKEVLLDGLPSWEHDPAYLDVLKRFEAHLDRK